MFSKLFAVCLIAIQATTVAASILPGVYRITNAASQSTVRSYAPGGPLYVSSTRENPGPFQLFNIQTAPGGSGYTIKNVGLNSYVSAPETAGSPLAANGNQGIYSINPAGGGAYVIKTVDKDLEWTVNPPIIPRGDVSPLPSSYPSSQVVLLPANGEPTQRYIFTLNTPN